MTFFLLAQDAVSHDRDELYAVIGALVLTIGYLERQRVRLTAIVSRMTKDAEEPD